MKQTCLMLGAGTQKAQRKFQAPTSASESETKWVTLDVDPALNPDCVFDLETIEEGVELPFEAETFDEVHAYEVLEHYGMQGDYRGFFLGFAELWRILKPGGRLIGTVPHYRSEWALGEPGHTRVITQGGLMFLTREHYDQLGQTAASDYRKYVAPYWWELESFRNHRDEVIIFGLKKVA